MLSVAVLALLVAGANAQTFRRAAACPGRTCIFPPDQTDFWPGQTFDIRFESHAPVNGSEAYNNGAVDGFVNIQFGPVGGDLLQLSDFFGRANPTPKAYNFTYFEDLFAQEARAPTPVNVISKSYRNVQLHNPGKYRVVATTAKGLVTEAVWEVRPLGKKVAKNVLFFVGDGMAGSMISAARLLAHKVVNGKYQSVMKMDEAPGYGSQMTHSLDSFITDSANSASALFTGKKMTVNGLNAYTDTSGSGYGNPAVETLFEQFRRTQAAQIGIVSKAYIADATPAAVCAHTSQRSQYTAIIEQFLSGITANQSWNPWEGVDVLFGGGAENFLPGPGNGNVSQFERWGQQGYQVGFNKTQLNAFDNEQRALGIFTQGNISTWLDQHVYPETLDLAIKPLGGRGAYDQPGLKDMTIKAIDILSTRAKSRGTGWALMSEAALIDKEMHVQDVDRALGDLLELDDTLRHTLEYLEKIGELDDTLVVVTADHGHGFDVFGSTDTEYLNSKDSDRAKRNAVGVYLESGLSAYQVPQGVNPAHNFSTFQSPQAESADSYFPITWEPRYTIAHGWAAFPDKREDFQVNSDHERVPAVRNSSGYFFNPEDNNRGFAMTGNLDTSSGQGVHSLVDVPVYAWGPGYELFRGVYSSVEIAFKVADALGIPVGSNITVPFQK